jgi:hypothetical protein
MTTNATPVTPSVLNPTPKNGATSQTQQTTEPKPASAAPSVEEREAQLKAREEALNKREKVWKDEAKKASDEKKGLGAKLKEYEELKKYKSEREARDEMRRLNPEYGLKEDFGDNYREKLTKLFVDGVPPADLIAAEFKRMRAEFKAELEAERAKTREQSTAAEAAEIEQTRAMVANDTHAFYESSAKDYPVFERIGDAQRVSQILAQRIEQEFMRTGKLLSPKEAADALEADMFGLVETAVSHEKYKSKLQDKLKPATVSLSSGAQGVPQSSQRRTLSNDLTASTSGRAPPRSEDERRERAIAVFNEVRAKGKA